MSKFFTLLLAAALTAGCNKGDSSREAEGPALPERLLLDRKEIRLDRRLAYYASPKGGYDTIRILKGNGRYKVTINDTLSWTEEFGDGIETKAWVCGDSIIVVHATSPVANLNSLAPECFCLDTYTVHDACGEKVSFQISSSGMFEE